MPLFTTLHGLKIQHQVTEEGNAKEGYFLKGIGLARRLCTMLHKQENLVLVLRKFLPPRHSLHLAD